MICPPCRYAGYLNLLGPDHEEDARAQHKFCLILCRPGVVDNPRREVPVPTLCDCQHAVGAGNLNMQLIGNTKEVAG